MTTTDLYARLDVLVNGVTQMELQNVKLTLDGGLIEVRTIQKGLAGYTESGGKANMQIGSAIPKGGLEFDFLSAVANHDKVDMELTIGGKSYQATGMFLNGDVSQSDNGSSAVNAEWQGELKALS